VVILSGYQNDHFAKDGDLRGVEEEPGRRTVVNLEQMHSLFQRQNRLRKNSHGG
jgi:hypothetical protein